MRILVVGAGATGGYFGGRLAQAGRDVTFLVRPARAARLKADGLRLVSPHGDATVQPNVVTAGALRGQYDAIVLGVKAYTLDGAIEDFAPAVGPNTSIVPLLNGMRHLDVLAARFGDRAVLGGVCIVATTIDDEERIVQLNGLQELVYGARDGTREERVLALDRALGGAGFTARSSERILHDMWQKWVFLASLGGINVTMRGSIGDVEAVPGGGAFARAFVDEALAVAAAYGHPMEDEFVARTRSMLTAPGSTMTSSMYRDLIGGRPVEADAIVGDLLARAREAGVATPLVAAAYANLSVYERHRLATAS